MVFILKKNKDFGKKNMRRIDIKENRRKWGQIN